jgi:hypothetical protein
MSGHYRRPNSLSKKPGDSDVEQDRSHRGAGRGSFQGVPAIAVQRNPTRRRERNLRGRPTVSGESRLARVHDGSLRRDAILFSFSGTRSFSAGILPLELPVVCYDSPKESHPSLGKYRATQCAKVRSSKYVDKHKGCQRPLQSFPSASHWASVNSCPWTRRMRPNLSRCKCFQSTSSHSGRDCWPVGRPTRCRWCPGPS